MRTRTVALPLLPQTFQPTKHLEWRMATRHISAEAISAALLYGRVVTIQGTDIHAIGRKEVRRHAQEGIDLSAFEGVQVVCASDGTVITAYRNRNFRNLKPYK